MDRILVVVFNEASQAFEGRNALKSLERDDSIVVHGYALVTKKADGTLVDEEDHHAGFGLPPGTSLRSLIDRFSKGSGGAISAAAESLAAGTEQDDARVVADFVNEVSKQLTPSKFALVAEIDEEWTPWINLRMTELGGVVYRCPLSDVKHVAEAAEIATMKANLALLKAEHAQARADRKAKLYDKINQLDTKIQQHLEKEKKQREEAERRAKAKAEMLKAKTSAAKAVETHV